MERLTKYLPERFSQKALRLEDIEGEEVVLVGARIANGQYGEYLFMDLQCADGKVITVMTGAQIVLESVKSALEHNALPLTARFVKKGRKWTIE
jgi:hypothetical protein